jgi:hypothetical protein
MRRTLAAAALLTASAALAGCGSSSVNPHAVAKAGAKTAKAGGYSLDLVSKLKVPGATRTFTFKGNGEFDPQHRRGRMSVDMSQLGQIAPGNPYNFGTMQLVLDGLNIYMRIPILKQIQPTLKPWIKLNLEEAGRTQGLDFSSFLQLGQGGDPTQTLGYLKGAGDVKKVGSEKVRGVQTTHYRATIDLRKVANQAPASSRARVRASIRRLIQLTGEKTIPTQVWIDGKGLVRRLAYTERLVIQGRRTKVSLKMDFYEFGTRVIANPPPASDVTDLSQIVAGRQGGGGA